MEGLKSLNKQVMIGQNFSRTIQKYTLHQEVFLESTRSWTPTLSENGLWLVRHSRYDLAQKFSYRRAITQTSSSIIRTRELSSHILNLLARLSLRPSHIHSLWLDFSSTAIRWFNLPCGGSFARKSSLWTWRGHVLSNWCRMLPTVWWKQPTLADEPYVQFCCSSIPPMVVQS